MENKNQQQTTQSQPPSSNQPTIAPTQLDDGYNVTVQVDPGKIDAAQMADDLKALKIATGEMKPEEKKEIAPQQEPKKEKPQELIALELANPFRGE